MSVTRHDARRGHAASKMIAASSLQFLEKASPDMIGSKGLARR
jgi:hypothetical protein